MGMTWSIIEYYFVRFGFLQSTNNNMFSALRVAAKRTATVARPTFARRALSAAPEGGKMEIVDADITDSIEWCMPSPPPQVRTLRSVFSFSFVFRTLTVIRTPPPPPLPPWACPSPLCQHMFEEPPIIVKVEGADEH
jgi:hypothetical protein